MATKRMPTGLVIRDRSIKIGAVLDNQEYSKVIKIFL